MDENGSQNIEPKVNLQELLLQFGADYPIDVVDSPESPRLSEIAALDAEAFGEHQTLTEEDLKHILSKGGVILGHTEHSGRLISEATLILNANPKGPSLLECGLPEWLGYCDGAAVSKEYRGKGLQKQLLLARHEVAKAFGKEATAASVRQTNVISIKSMFKTGYVMLADSPQYYGESPEDARVVMLNDFEVGNPFAELDSDHEMLDEILRGVIDPSVLREKLSAGSDIISLAVHQSDEVKEEYNMAVATLLRNGYIGVACSDIDIGDSDGERANAMTFIRFESLPLDAAEAIRLRQREVQSIVG